MDWAIQFYYAKYAMPLFTKATDVFFNHLD